MSYRIIDSGANISICLGEDEMLIRKYHITRMEVIKSSVLKIERLEPLSTIFLRFSDVIVPLQPTPEDLRDAINMMVTDCVCSGSKNGGGE